jgi:hypothetical protein
MSYVEVREPGGTLLQPIFSPTSLMYSLLVAHLMNLIASSWCLVDFGTARFQLHSQPDSAVLSTGMWA